MLRALLADMRLVRLGETDAELACAAHARPVAEKKLGDLSKLMSELAGKPITARLIEGEPEPATTGASEARPEPIEPDVDHPIVKKTLELFNGRIIDVKPVRSKPTDEPGEI